MTFLLTDVEASTRRWEHAPGDMAVAVARHYELLDRAITEHNGVRPVEQGAGDSVVGAFARASDALAAALDAQRAMCAEDWPDGASLSIRVAVHTGEAELRDEGNYFGSAVIRCARLCAIANGGQVLVSGATADLVGDRLPVGAGLADLGNHRLKDLGRSEHVWELRHPDLPTGFAALRSLDNLPNNLPVQLTSFVGRGAELAEMRGLIATTRLLSVNGAGGCGKTRLALQLGAEVLDRYAGGAWLAELAAVLDPDRVATAVASALGERDLSGDLVEAMAIRVGDRPTLLLLDNCEHVLGAVAALVDALLRRIPRLTIVATSREPLGVPGEIAWRVPSMPAPATTEPLPLEALSQFDAVRLFLDRATKARPNFRLTNANGPAVAQICHRLDGIPLALELAAARVRALTVEQLAAGLDNRFQLLTGGARTVLPRQQTLQASVDWSYELLSERERALFRRLAVFAGGFTLDAAEQVVAGDDIEAIDVLDLLVALVDKSMVDTDDEHGRYRVLESLRQYATARLVEAAETAAARDRHLAWARDTFDVIEVLGSDRFDALARFESDIDNYRAAFEWALLASDADAAAQFAGLLCGWETLRGDPRAGISFVRRGLGVPGAAPRVRLAVIAISAYAHAEAGDIPQLNVAVDEMLRGASDLDDAARSVCLVCAAAALFFFGDGFRRVVPIALEAAAAAQRARQVDVERRAHASLALVQFVWGDWREGEEYAQLVGGDPATSGAAANVAYGREYAAWVTGRFDEARDLLDTLTFLSNPRMEASRELSRLQLDLAQGVESGALAQLECALAEARGRGFESALGQLGWGPGTWQMAYGDAEAGALAVVAWRDEIESRWGTFAIPALITLGRLAEARAELEAERGIFWGAEAGAMRATFDAVVTRLEGDVAHAEQIAHGALVAQHQNGYRPLLVHTLEALAGIAGAQESYVECARLYGAARALRDEMGYVLRWPYETRQRERDVAAARVAIGEERFDAAFEEGRTLDLDAAVSYAQRARGERKRPTTGWKSLTPTELEVARQVTAGLTNKQIGHELLMGSETVKTHLSHVYDKLGIRSRAALAAELASRTDAAG